MEPIIVRADEKQKLAYRQTFRLSLRDARNETWEGLHEMRREIADAMQKTIDRADQDKRDLNEVEQRAMELGGEFLDSVKREFENREARGQKGPVDYSSRPPGMFAGDTSGKEKFLKPQGREFRVMFPDLNSKNEFRSWDDFVEAISYGKADTRLERRLFAETGGAVGGFDVPVEYSEIIFDKSLENEIVRSRASVFPMKSQTRMIPAWDNSDQSETVYGGFTGQWLGQRTEREERSLSMTR